MGGEIASLKKATARRRGRTDPGGTELHPYVAKAGGPKWGWIISGSFLLALVAFISGIWVGKTVNDIQYNEKLSYRSKPEKGKKDFLYQAELTRKEDPAKRETKAFTVELPDKRGEKEKVSPTRPKVGEEKILGPAAETASPQGAKSGPAKVRFTLQIGAFNNTEEAQQMVNHLKGKGYAAYQITGSAAAKGMWYRVRVGHFPSLQEARQFALMFEKKEKIKTIITTVPAS